MSDLFYQPLLPDALFLDRNESHHCVNVLRHKNGDGIRITDGMGNLYNAIITKADPSTCEFRITRTQKTVEQTYTIHLAIAPTKQSDRMEWMVEKAVEIGVDEITFIQCKHSERNKVNIERMIKKSIGAMKQSQRTILPVINAIVEFEQFLSQGFDGQKLVAHKADENDTSLARAAKPGNNYLLLVGPEGGFHPDELQKATDSGFMIASLGSNRLRTETAGLAGVIVLNQINE